MQLIEILLIIILKTSLSWLTSFHVAKNINDALKNLRIHIMYKYDKDSVEYYLLMMRKGNIEDNLPKFNKKIGYMINKPRILSLMPDIDPFSKKLIFGKKII